MKPYPLLTLLLILSLSGCTLVYGLKARNGVLVVSHDIIEKKGIFSLNGEWEFYWKEFLKPGEKEPTSSERDFLILPGIWNGKYYKGKKLSGEGFASFRLFLIFEQPFDKIGAIYIKNFSTSYNIYWNGELVASNGVVGKSYDQTEPFFKPSFTILKTVRMTNEILIHIANFSYFQGGPWNEIIFGEISKITDYLNQKFIFSSFVLCAMIVTGLFHLLIFLIRKQTG